MQAGAHRVLQQSARATVIVERTIIEDCQVSPSVPGCPATQAVDYVYILSQRENPTAWFAKTYGKYEVLRALEYTPSGSPQPPFAIQLSALVSVVHQCYLDSHPYVHDCHCFLHTVFEASKELFPGGEEHRYRHPTGDRSSLKVQTFDLHDLHSVCQMYERSWEELVQRHAIRVVGIRKLEELNRELRGLLRDHEEERRAREESIKKLEEAHRHFQEVCNAHAARVQDLQQALQDYKKPQAAV
ncbi:hypothetical protein EDC04DRAFT_2955923 [Pisolithus marmoratus]|nr:hypothetical protein EDC04DRAFT_2955923 [Pisolithus marmoratus]